MITVDFHMLGNKFASIQTGLTNLFDLNQIQLPFFKRDEKYCENVVSELDNSQIILCEKNDNISFKKDINCENNSNTDSRNHDNFISIDLFGNPLNYKSDDIMVKKSEFKELARQRIKEVFKVDDIDEYDESNILSYPDNRFKMIKRICPHCSAIDANVNKWEKRKYKNKKNISVTYYPQSYICNKCGKWFITPIKFNLDKDTKEKIRLDKKICDLHANTSLSFDKIAEVIEITMNINLSHEYVRNVVQKKYDDFVYQTEIVPLPEDFKKKGKTSQERGVTDIGLITMFKKTNIEFSGEIEVDELFTDINGKRYYTVNVFANDIKDMPIAVAIVNTRHYDVMIKFFEFIFVDKDFKALTSDMLGVYNKITEKKKVPQQTCIFHWMKYQGKTIFENIKKEDYSEIDSVWYLILFTEMKEILRSFNPETTKNLISKFKDHLSNIPEFLQKIVDKFFKKIEKLTEYQKNHKILRTTSKAENFNSLPQIRHIKNTSKKPQSLLLSLSSIIKFYKPNFRTLKTRHN